MSKRALFVIALMLFSMFFGAGNLIFPPMLGANAGDNFVPAVTGFLISGVALPVLAIIAIALSGQDIRALAARAGTVFTIVFSIAIYLSIGTFFGIPRTGAVSFSTAVSPVTGWESTPASVGFNLVFFAVATWLALNPSGLVDRLGKVLTPALLTLLAVLIVLSLFQLHNPGAAPTEEYAASPFPAGLMEGYFTMDSLAALAFGILVISAIKEQKIANPLPGTTMAALGAGALLGTIYLGLAIMGSRIPEGQSYKDGATLLSHASLQVLGFPGQVVLGGVVLLACLTTAVGLLASWAGYANTVWPAVSFKRHLLVGSAASLILASLGLDAILTVTGPITLLLYPLAICLVVVTLLDAIAPGRLRSAYLWPVSVAGALGLVSALAKAGWRTPSDLLSRTGLWDDSTGWILPALIALGVGLALDVRAGRWSAPARGADDDAVSGVPHAGPSSVDEVLERHREDRDDAR